MCGFIGIFGGVSEEHKFVVHKMMDLVEHRGPDAKHTKSYSQALLGHVRLKKFRIFQKTVINLFRARTRSLS